MQFPGAADLCKGLGEMPRCYDFKYPATLNRLVFNVLFFMEMRREVGFQQHSLRNQCNIFLGVKEGLTSGFNLGPAF